MHRTRQALKRFFPLKRLVHHADHLTDGIDEIVFLGPIDLDPAFRQMLRKDLAVRGKLPGHPPADEEIFETVFADERHKFRAHVVGVSRLVTGRDEMKNIMHKDTRSGAWLEGNDTEDMVPR